MKQRTIFTLLILGMLATASHAVPDSVRTWNIGLSNGSLTGTGISYRYWFPGQLALQVAATPFAVWSGDEYFLFLDVGGTVQKVFHEGDRIRLMMYAGGSYRSTFDRNEDGVTTSDNKFMKVGFGPAIEYPMKNFTYTFGCGLAFKSDLKEEMGISYALDMTLHYAFGEARK